MPYSGIAPGSEMERKIERCVESAMGDDPNLDKSSAIAICRDSIEKEMTIEKFMWGASGSTSFAELDAQRAAHEQAMALMHLTSDFQSLVDNIMWSPEISDKASAVRQLSSEFADRLETGDYDKGITLYKQVTSNDDTPPPKRDKKESFASKFVSAIKGLVGQAPKQELNSNGFFVYKDKGGTYRWIARYSNNLRDDDNPPEIISSKSHQRFEALVDAGVVPPPELWLWHNKDWKFGESEWVAYDNAGFALAGGYIYPGCEEIAKSLQGISNVGVSHGMRGEFIRRDKDDPSIIVQHVTHEISPLPMWAAANKRTGFVVLDEDIKEINMLSKDKRHELIDKWGLPEDYLAALERMNQEDAAGAVGVESKEVSDSETAATPEPVAAEPVQAAPTEEPVAEAETEEAAPEPAAAEEVAPVESELVTAVQEAMKAIMVLTKEVREVAADVAKMKGSEEERIIAKVKQTPLASMTQLMVNSVIGSEEARVDGRTSLAKSGPVETEPTVKSVVGIPLLDNWITNADQRVN